MRHPMQMLEKVLQDPKDTRDLLRMLKNTMNHGDFDEIVETIFSTRAIEERRAEAIKAKGHPLGRGIFTE